MQLQRGFGFYLDGEFQALLRGERFEGGLDVLEQRAEREALRVDVHPPRLYLGQVEDVVDELQQVRARRVNDVGVLDLLGGQVPARVLHEQPGQGQEEHQRGA